MRQVSNLGRWINEKYRSQVVFAEKVGAHPTMVSRWLSGKEGVSPDYQDKIRALKYVGPWPREEAQETPAQAGGPYVTEKDFAEWRGYWRAGTEGVLERLATAEKTIADLVRRLDQLEGSK
jgi:hypothetical protein